MPDLGCGVTQSLWEQWGEGAGIGACGAEHPVSSLDVGGAWLLLWCAYIDLTGFVLARSEL